MSKADKGLERQLDHLAVLGDPVRRALYFHVAGLGDEVSRDQAATAAGISRALAAFHLDKLVESGLLETSFRRLSARSGPGAGRPNKLYRRSSRQIDVTLPARRYELIARLLARAMSAEGAAPAAALEQAAEEFGRQLGTEARGRSGAQADSARLLRGAIETLQDAGFEPRQDANGDILLGNCPFAAVQRESPALTCGMNLALCRGMVAGLEAESWRVRLEPRAGRCCVVIQTQ